jgi:hypothetical protein
LLFSSLFKRHTNKSSVNLHQINPIIVLEKRPT